MASTPSRAGRSDSVHARPPGFCTGCPERPIFSAMKLVERELGPHHVSADIGCHLFSILPPFNLGNTTMGYGLGAAGAAALNVPAGKRAISMMGDGGFWHNGLTSGIANAVFNRSDNLTIVVDNNYTSATGGQDILSSKAHNASAQHRPRDRAGGARRRREVGAQASRRTYDVAGMRDTLREALTTKEKGPKVLIAQSECMLNKQRREKPLVRKAVADGQARGAREVRRRFRHLHRRPLVHPPVGLPLAVDQAQPRSAAHRPGRHRARQLRGLRPLRRRVACGGAVPLVLQGAGGEQPERLGPLRASACAAASSAGCSAATRGGASATPSEPTRTRHPQMNPAQPIKIAILAMGGEGGGVLADWIVDLGEHNGYIAQTTSVPGVAQRTGATIYYVELYPAGAGAGRWRPAGAGADAAAGRRRRGAGLRADGSRPRGAARAGHARPHHAASPPRTASIRSPRSRRWATAGSTATQLLAHGEQAAKRFIRFDMARAGARTPAA